MLVIPIGDGEGLGDRILGEDIIEESVVRFVGVIRRVPVWFVRWRAANTMELGFEGWKRVEEKPEPDLPEEDVASRMRQTESVLNV